MDLVTFNSILLENERIKTNWLFGISGYIGDYFRLLTRGNYFIAAMHRKFMPAFSVTDVPVAPDLNSGDFHEAKRIKFLLADSHLRSHKQMDNLSLPYEKSENLHTTFSLNKEEKAWLPVFLRLFRNTEVYMSLKYEVRICF